MHSACWNGIQKVEGGCPARMLFMSKMNLAVRCVLALFLSLSETVAARDGDKSGQKTADYVSDPKQDQELQSRFLSPVTLEGLGRLFMLQSELSSCYSCSSSYPQHSSTCCVQGYSNCCVFRDPYLNSGVSVTAFGVAGSPGYSVAGFNGPSVKTGICPAAAPIGSHSCSRHCAYDAECPAEFKCCVYGCSMLCSRPRQANDGSSVPHEKSGYCPPNSEIGNDAIVTAGSEVNYGYSGYGYYNRDYYQHCSSDSDCPGSYKCCLRQYQRTCVVPTFSYSTYSFGRK